MNFSFWVNILIGAFVLALLFGIQVVVRAAHPFRCMVFSMLRGIAVLFLVNALGVFTGVMLPVSLLSLVVSAVVGIPGITAMLLFNLIL